MVSHNDTGIRSNPLLSSDGEPGTASSRVTSPTPLSISDDSAHSELQASLTKEDGMSQGYSHTMKSPTLSSNGEPGAASSRVTSPTPIPISDDSALSDNDLFDRRRTRSASVASDEPNASF